ncbi:hypothetical protein HAX54_026276, partial [Datura stramonium]|nr:hypothetical protein [Datura stramonium]
GLKLDLEFDGFNYDLYLSSRLEAWCRMKGEKRTGSERIAPEMGHIRTTDGFCGPSVPP